MDIVETLKTIKEDWALLVFFFTLGGFWWQGKAWFKKINETLTQVGADHAQQNKSLAELHIKIDNLDERVDKLELASTRLHEELHDAEVQLAVLQSRDVNEDKAIRRISRRKTG